MSARLAVFLLLTLSVLPASVLAQAELITGLGGPAGFGGGVLEYNDDGSSAEIDLRPAFPNGLLYFGQRFHSVFVNNNGSITFGGATSTYTPQRFPVRGNRMIAPFWADVDTRVGGRPQRNGVYWDVRPGQLVVTWHNVGFFPSSNSRENTFQLVILSDENLDRDNLWKVQFRYARCEWTTGGASGGQGGLGGSPAQAGFDAGNGQIYEILPGSGTEGVLQLCRTSNVGLPGFWEFDIYLGNPQVADPNAPQVQTQDFSRPAPTPRPRRRRN
ncbi:MAG: hypothetical protein K8H88_10550 [Sandaracinaceae bacterium]|nr:hypothetical protein [Sandaracinaceae bacterium]